MKEDIFCCCCCATMSIIPFVLCTASSFPLKCLFDSFHLFMSIINYRTISSCISNLLFQTQWSSANRSQTSKLTFLFRLQIHSDAFDCQFVNDAGVKYALLLGRGPKLRGIQVASSKTLWLFVDCWRWHENAGRNTAISLNNFWWEF